MCSHGDVFPSWNSNIGSLVLMDIFLIYLAVQVNLLRQRFENFHCKNFVNFDEINKIGKTN